MAAGDAGRRGASMLTLLWLSLPFAVAAAACFVVAEMKGGWAGLDWAVYGAAVLAAWGLVVLGFFVWLMASHGLFAWHGVPLALFVVLAAAGLVWGGVTWRDNARCRADAAFYDALAATPMAGRAEFVAARADRPGRLTPCGRDTLVLQFVADRYAETPPTPEAETDRIATLALLLDHGLPPDDALFHHAVAAADPAFVRLLVERRAGSGGLWEPLPLRFAEQALAALDMDPASPDHAAAERYLQILALFIDRGFDVCQPVSETTRFRDELERKGVPDTLWRDAAAGC